MASRPRAIVACLAIIAAAGPAAALGICVEGAYPPFSQVNADGSITGFDIDIAMALCAEMGETCGLVRENWTELIPALRGGACDAIVASMSDTAARRELIAFTAPYYRSAVRFVGPAGAGTETAADAGWLGSHVVGVQMGTTNQYFMQAHYPETTLRYYGNQEHLLLDLDAGRVDAVLGEAVQLDTGFLRTPAGAGFAFIGPPLFDPAIQGSGAAIGVRQGDTELRDRLNAAIASLRETGAYQKISDQYFGVDIYGQ